MMPATARTGIRSARTSRRLGSLDAAAELIAGGRLRGHDARRRRRARRLQPRPGDGAASDRRTSCSAALVDRITAGWSHRNVLPRTVGRPGRDGILILIDAIRAQAERYPPCPADALRPDVRGPRPERCCASTSSSSIDTMRSDLAELVRRGLRDGSIGRQRRP